MTAGNYDITIEAGATFRLSLTWKDDNGDVIDLTGFSARMQVRETYESEAAILSLTSADGDIQLGDALGTIVVTAEASVTEKISCASAVYDIELQSGSGVVTRLLQGSVAISREVTR